MSYFKALKLTKKGEQLQAKVNGNLSETLVFTRAKLGAGTITSEDEIRFLTDIKEMWGTANVSSCKIEGEDKNRVALELQFSNAELVEEFLEKLDFLQKEMIMRKYCMLMQTPLINTIIYLL